MWCGLSGWGERLREELRGERGKGKGGRVEGWKEGCVWFGCWDRIVGLYLRRLRSSEAKLVKWG